MSYQKPTDLERRRIFENSLVSPASSLNQLNGRQKTQIVNNEGEAVDLALLLLNSTRSETNNRTTPLSNGETFTGTSEQNTYRDAMVSCKTDQTGILYFDFSNDDVNWDTFPTSGFSVAAGTHEIHIAVKGPRYFRVRFYNNSGADQSYLRLYTYYGDFRQLNNPLNSTIQRDADTIVVRPLDFNLLTAEGLYQNTQNTIKDGFTPLIASGNVTQDLWTTAGAYTGFPASAAAAELVLAGADTGTVYYSYLESETSTDYVFGSKAVAGIGTYALGHNIWRCNFMFFVASSTTVFNVGTMTIRHTATPANIFVTILAGYSQSYCAAYTVPYQSAIYFDRINGGMKGSASGTLDGFYYYRAYGESPRLRFPFELQFGSLYFDDVDYLIKIPARTDIMPRIVTSSTNNLV